MFKVKVFNKIVGVILALVLVINVAPVYLFATAEISLNYPSAESADTDIAVSFSPVYFPAEAFLQADDEDIVFSMNVTATSNSSDDLFESTSPGAISMYPAELALWWYQDGVRRTDKGVTYISADNTSAIDLKFDFVTLADAGEWTLRVYDGNNYTESPYMLSLQVDFNGEDIISIMPLAGTLHYVADETELEALLPITEDITIILTDSFTMLNTIIIPHYRHVTIISDGVDEHVLTAPPNSRHVFIPHATAASGSSAGILTLGADNNADANSFILMGNGVVSGVGGSISFEGFGQNASGGILNMYGGTITGNESTGIGGAVHLGSNSELNMHGGRIFNNTAGGGGGGVGVATTGSQYTHITMFDGEISGNEAIGAGGGILMHSLGTFTMYSGIIEDNTATTQGGGVAVMSSVNNNTAAIQSGNIAFAAIFNMYGGTITDNHVTGSGSAHVGGGVHLGNNTRFNMHPGAVISDNTAVIGGGGVAVQPSGSQFTNINLHGGEISGNEATGVTGAGGGVFMHGRGTLAMHSGAIIEDNTAARGGGVVVMADVANDPAAIASGNIAVAATFNMLGGIITDNHAIGTATADAGGGVRLSNNTRFNMHPGAVISDNTAIVGGGGVGVQTTTTQITHINMHGGTISGNEAIDGSGGGVLMHSTGTFTMHAGTISGNTSSGTEATHGGGGVHLALHTTFIMHSAAVITLNIANNNGGGVHTANSGSVGSTFIMHGGTISYNRTPIASNFHSGGGIHLQGTGTVFTMHDGLIYGNEARYGGGVRIGLHAQSNAIFHMLGGTIENNTAHTTGTSGGGVHVGLTTEFNIHPGAVITRNHGMGNGGGVATNSTSPDSSNFVTMSVVNMFGGTISYNEAHGTSPANSQGGGGVFLQGTLSEFNMSGGTIHGNQTSHRGGGVLVRQGTFNMTGGVISENIAQGNGGGVQVDNNAPASTAINIFNMYGGEIRNNTAHGNGGGIATRDRAEVNITNANTSIPTEIHNNEALGSLGGGGVFLQGALSRLEMDGGIVHNNDAIHGGGIRVQEGIFIMNGGEIDNNTASVNGGGIWVNVHPTIIRMYSGTITNNTATVGDGGGIFANPTWIASILPSGAYPNIDHFIAGAITFSGNIAGGGLFPLPENYTDFSFGAFLTNHNINYRTSVLVIFDLAGGNVGGTASQIPLVVQPGQLNSTIDTLVTVPEPMREGYTFLGWRNPDNELLNSDGEPIVVILQLSDVEAHTVTSSTVFVAQWSPIMYTVTFNLNGGSGTAPADQLVQHGQQATNPGNYLGMTAPADYEFVGWYTQATGGEAFNFATGITENRELFARWQVITTYQLNINVVDVYGNQIPGATVTFNGANIVRDASSGYWVVALSAPTEGNISATATGFVSGNAVVLLSDFYGNVAEATIVLLKQPPSNGSGTGTDDGDSGEGAIGGTTPPPVTLPPTTYEPELPLNAGELFHARFMIGFPDGRFMPHNSTTRAETAAALVRTMTTIFGVNVPRAPVASIEGKFSDVDSNAWYFEYLAIAYSYNLIQGFPDGTFRPNDSITREQFAAMLARTRTIQTGGTLPYIDTADVSDWAFDYVYTALVTGLMHGDAIGTFRPIEPISRAEAAAAFNRILGRGDTTSRSIEGVPNIIIFPDAADRNMWFFYYVVEATNSHWFTMDGTEELWTSVRTYN